jgi:predicted DNA binding CopG/RHH family protein
MVVGIDNYAYLVPYIEDKDELFLKTIIPKAGRQQKDILEKNMKTRLTKEENEIVESFEQGEWIPVKDLSKRKKELMQYARNTLRKDKRINIRISERDLIELQRKAVREGLPYQTFVSSIIHKFINGTLIEEKR